MKNMTISWALALLTLAQWAVSLLFILALLKRCFHGFVAMSMQVKCYQITPH